MSNCDIWWRLLKYLGFRCSCERASLVEARRVRLSCRHFLRKHRNSVVPYELHLDYVFQRMDSLLSTEYINIHVQDVALLSEYLPCVWLALCGPPVQRLSSRTSDT